MRVSLYGAGGPQSMNHNHNITRSPQVNKKFRRDYYMASQNTVVSASAHQGPGANKIIHSAVGQSVQNMSHISNSRGTLLSSKK